MRPVPPPYHDGQRSFPSAAIQQMVCSGATGDAPDRSSEPSLQTQRVLSIASSHRPHVLPTVQGSTPRQPKSSPFGRHLGAIGCGPSRTSPAGATAAGPEAESSIWQASQLTIHPPSAEGLSGCCTVATSGRHTAVATSASVGSDASRSRCVGNPWATPAPARPPRPCPCPRTQTKTALKTAAIDRLELSLCLAEREGFEPDVEDSRRPRGWEGLRSTQP